VKDLRELYLRATGLNINQILVLTYSDYLQQLETLDLRCNQFGSPREMQALVGMRRFPLLKHLDLTSCAVGDAGLKSLVKTPLWRQWETLVLWNNEITDRGVIEMAQAQPPAKLRALELRRNLIGDAGLAALSSSPVLSAFSELHLEHNRIEDAGTLALARSRHADNLRELHLRGNQAITDRGGIALAGAGFPALEVLDLAGTAVGDACAMALAEFPSSASLRVLDLGGTRITQTGALALAKSPHLGILEFLDLRMNHLKGDCVVALVERFGKRVLT
jgi:Ran GTPase-activating protein (RanGAP) involved in mRNA processing and transport